ncbi:MAG: PilZ domain-containing protein [Bryobacteraceae bacterium]
MEQRRTRRFKLQLPLSITRSGAERVAFDGLTKNISSTGVLFTAGGSSGLSGPIEYIITLNHTDRQTVNLRCMGKVVRAERIGAAGGLGAEPSAFQVAATLERYEFVRAQ